jgi:hypothetical protein
MGYKISGKKIVDIYNNVHEEKSINVACMAYMDDTNIISNNKEKVKKILEHVNEFNDLNDIQINKEKLEILLRKNDKKDEKKIILQFGDKMINITPIKRDQSYLFNSLILPKIEYQAQAIVFSIYETEIKMAEMVEMVEMVEKISTWTLPKVEMAEITSYYIILIRYK